MSLVDDKRKVFTTIGSYTSFMQQNKLPNVTDIYTSINNKKDIISYLLDVLKTVAGTEALKELIGKMLTKLVDQSESKIKMALKKQFVQFNADNLLSSNFINNGINTKVEDIDIKGKLRISPTSDSGNLIYNKTVDSFDKIAHDAIVNSGTDVSFAGMNMSIKYVESIDTFNIKPLANVKIGDYFTNYIDKTQIINKDEFITNIMDTIYGVFSKKNNKTAGQVLNDLEVQKLLEQVINNNDSFLILPEDYDELQKKANELANGVTYYDMGCGLMEAILPFSGLTKLIGIVSGSTDPFTIGNAVEATIAESTTGSPTTAKKNKETIRDGFFQKLINVFTIQMLQFSIMSPQIRVLLGIMSSLQNNGLVLIANAKEDMKKFAIMIKCMANEIIKMIAEFIFNLVVSYLIKLLTPVIKKMLKEKINQYINIIKSLTPISKLINST